MQTEVIVVTETPGGKEIGYRPVDGTALYEVAFKDGGAIPKALQGRYTHVRGLMNKIQAWAESDEAKERAQKNAAATAKKQKKKETE